MTQNSLKRKKICIVDDDASIREIFMLKLSSEGYDVVTASDGNEGWSVIKSQRPDVALIDIMMPGTDGLGLIEMMEKDEELSKIPVVVLTNLDDEETLQKIQKLHTKFHLVKSLFEPQKVVGIVKELV